MLTLIDVLRFEYLKLKLDIYELSDERYYGAEPKRYIAFRYNLEGAESKPSRVSLVDTKALETYVNRVKQQDLDIKQGLEKLGEVSETLRQVYNTEVDDWVREGIVPKDLVDSILLPFKR